MKNLIGSLFCGLLLTQAATTHTFNEIRPTKLSSTATAELALIAAASAYGLYKEYKLAGLNRIHAKECYQKAQAIHNKLLSEFAAKVQAQEVAWQESIKNNVPQDELNTMYIDLQQNRTRLEKLAQGKIHFEEEWELLHRAKIFERPSLARVALHGLYVIGVSCALAVLIGDTLTALFGTIVTL